MRYPYFTKDYYARRYNEMLVRMIKDFPHSNDVLHSPTITECLENNLERFRYVSSIDKKFSLLIQRRILKQLESTHKVVEYDLHSSQGIFKRYKLAPLTH
jgi:hypothetical protein